MGFNFRRDVVCVKGEGKFVSCLSRVSEAMHTFI